jgi:hypothetical protein
VFNLNNIARLCSGTYVKYKRCLVLKIKQDSDIKWSERGRRLENFLRKAEKMEPSGWMIVIFFLHKGLKILGISRVFRKRPRHRKIAQETRSKNPELQYKDSELNLSMFNQLSGSLEVGSSAEAISHTAKRGSGIFGSFSKFGSIFRRGALVPPSTVV